MSKVLCTSAVAPTKRCQKPLASSSSRSTASGGMSMTPRPRRLPAPTKPRPPHASAAAAAAVQHSSSYLSWLTHPTPQRALHFLVPIGRAATRIPGGGCNAAGVLPSHPRATSVLTRTCPATREPPVTGAWSWSASSLLGKSVFGSIALVRPRWKPSACIHFRSREKTLRCMSTNETLTPLMPYKFCCAGKTHYGCAHLRRRRC
jgi:hypothetical protein